MCGRISKALAFDEAFPPSQRREACPAALRYGLLSSASVSSQDWRISCSGAAKVQRICPYRPWGEEPLSLLAVCRPGTSVVRVPHSHQGLDISSGCKHAAAEESTELWGLARQGTPRSHPIWPSRKTTEPPWVSTLSCARLGLIPEHSLCSVISREDPAEEATCPILDHASVEVVCAKERSQGGPTIITPCLGARGACTRTFVPLPHAYYVHYVPSPQP